MMSRRIFGLNAFWLLAGSAGAALTGCASSNKALRYRITIEVDTPLGLRTGTSVLESVYNNGNAFENSARAWTRGQAPYVDLGNGRYLFSTLSDPFEKSAMFQILLKVLRHPETKPPLSDPDRSAVDQANTTKPFGIVRRQDYPLLITFRNVEIPETVEEVDPADLSTIFGQGHAVKSITIQVLDRNEHLTKGFEDRFPEIAKFDRPFREKPQHALRSSDRVGQLQNGYFVRRT